MTAHPVPKMTPYRASSREAVVLLHGLAANRLAMARLAWSLSARNYQVENWGYSSTRSSIEDISRQFLRRLNHWAETVSPPVVHLVTHSMGGVIVRRAFQSAQPGYLGRIVMLAPPHGGSHVARKLAPYLGKLCPPLRELSDEAESYVNSLGLPRGLHLGIIAAARDRVVQLSSTYLGCQADHIILPGHHGTLPWQGNCVHQVLYFLREGQFDHSTEWARDGIGQGIQYLLNRGRQPMGLEEAHEVGNAITRVGWEATAATARGGSG